MISYSELDRLPPSFRFGTRNFCNLQRFLHNLRVVDYDLASLSTEDQIFSHLLDKYTFPDEQVELGDPPRLVPFFKQAFQINHIMHRDELFMEAVFCYPGQYGPINELVFTCHKCQFAEDLAHPRVLDHPCFQSQYTKDHPGWQFLPFIQPFTRWVYSGRVAVSFFQRAISNKISRQPVRRGKCLMYGCSKCSGLEDMTWQEVVSTYRFLRTNLSENHFNRSLTSSTLTDSLKTDSVLVFSIP